MSSIDYAPLIRHQTPAAIFVRSLTHRNIWTVPVGGIGSGFMTYVLYGGPLSIVVLIFCSAVGMVAAACFYRAIIGSLRRDARREALR